MADNRFKAFKTTKQETKYALATECFQIIQIH